MQRSKLCGWVLLLALPTSGALASDADDGILAASIRVGETAAVEVGPAKGVVCDDQSIVKAEMTAGSATNNRLVLTGLKAGATLCRAGSDQLGFKRFVRVTVSAAGDKEKPSPDSTAPVKGQGGTH